MGSFITLGVMGTVLALYGCEALAKKKELSLQPKEEVQIHIAQPAPHGESPILLQDGPEGKEEVEREVSLGTRLEELKVDLIRHNYGHLIEQIDEGLFPYRQLEQRLRELTGIDFQDKPLPRLRVRSFSGDGDSPWGLEEIAALYKREENAIYFDPSILAEREKEAIYHEFFHSKGYFAPGELNEGFVEYLTILATGLPPARYGIRAFNVHNLAFLVGRVASEAIRSPIRLLPPEEKGKERELLDRLLKRELGEAEGSASKGALPNGAPPSPHRVGSSLELEKSEVLKQGLSLMAAAFHRGSLAPLISWLNHQEPALGDRLLVQPFRAEEDGLESLRLALALEDGLNARGFGLQEWPEAELLLGNFGFISFSQELYPTVLDFCEKVLKTRPDSTLSPHLHVAMGNLYLKQGVPLKAKESYGRALEELGEDRFPKELVKLSLVACYRSLGLFPQALATLEELCRSQQSFLRAKAYFLRAEIYAQQKEYRKALRELYQLRSQPLGLHNAWYLANSYLEAGKLLAQGRSYQEALGELAAGIKRFPDAVAAVEAKLKIGEIYEKLRLYRQARDSYLWLVQERPLFHWATLARFRLGNLYLTVYRDRQVALKYFHEVILRAPFSQEAALSRKICQDLEQHFPNS